MEDLNLEVEQVKLGEVRLKNGPTAESKEQLKQGLERLGFELLDDQKSALVNRIKALIIKEIHHKDELSSSNLSELIAKDLKQDYGSLSRLFSSVEGHTIERFTALQRIEKIKEFLVYDQLSLAEIADKLGLSSASYVSNLFKKETGMTPGQFKKDQAPRKSIDQL